MIELGVVGPATPQEWASLSDAERERAARFRFAADRDRFVRRRAGLRSLLAARLGIEARGVQLRAGAHGKPELAAEHDRDDLQFNASSSGGVALVAMATGARVGIDVERVDPVVEIDALSRRFFSRAEQAALQGRPEAARLEVFFSCWTMKEAFVKARGDGLSLPLDEFDVDPDASGFDALRATRWNRDEAAQWSLGRVAAPAGHAAALAVEGGAVRVVTGRVDEARSG